MPKEQEYRSNSCEESRPQKYGDSGWGAQEVIQEKHNEGSNPRGGVG